MEKFNNIISLGFFCSVALECEKIGLRGASYPFDWLISDFEGCIECIDNEFKDFLNYDTLAQYKNEKGYYYNSKYKFHFYHDFSKYKDLDSQLDEVKRKYNRRINRFKEDIKKPTLFLKYIKDSAELQYIEENYDYIMKVLKKSNKYNELLLISNDEISNSSLKIYKVKKDVNDFVAREFLSKNIDLKNYLLSDIYDSSKRKNNLKVYLQSSKKKKITKYLKKVKSIYNKLFKNVYTHHKIMDDL